MGHGSKNTCAASRGTSWPLGRTLWSWAPSINHLTGVRCSLDLGSPLVLLSSFLCSSRRKMPGPLSVGVAWSLLWPESLFTFFDLVLRKIWCFVHPFWRFALLPSTEILLSIILLFLWDQPLHFQFMNPVPFCISGVISATLLWAAPLLMTSRGTNPSHLGPSLYWGPGGDLHADRNLLGLYSQGELQRRSVKMNSTRA